MVGQCKINVSPGFFIFFAILLLLLPMGWVFAWGFSMAIHELGHLAAAMILGVPVYTVELRTSGAKIYAGPMEVREELICALAGPAAGALLILLGRWLPWVGVCAFFHTVVNLIPLGNLDGGRVLRCILRKIPCKPGK